MELTLFGRRASVGRRRLTYNDSETQELANGRARMPSLAVHNSGYVLCSKPSCRRFHPGKQLAQSHAVTTGGLAQNVSGAYVAKWNFFFVAEVLLLTLV